MNELIRQIINETKEILSEAEVLNEIENRIRQHKKVSQKEINLLISGYECFCCNIPKDIYKELKGGLKE